MYILEREKIEAFTFIELITSIVVIAAVVIGGTVSFSTLVPSRLDADVRKIVSDISWAKQKAITTHQHHALSFDTVNKQYSVYKSPTGTVADFTTLNFLKKTVVQASLALIQQNLWIYSPKGDTYGTGNITLTYQGKTKQVNVFSKTGYVEIQ
jgi:Tfp pilus assembly protein FimT